LQKANFSKEFFTKISSTDKNSAFLSPLHCHLYTVAIMESERIKKTAEIAITAAIYPR
jgi:hypothetical protein